MPSQTRIDSLIIDAQKFFYREFNEETDIQGVLELISKYPDIPDGVRKANIERIFGHYYSSIFDLANSLKYMSAARERFKKHRDWKNYVCISKDYAIALRENEKTEFIEEALLEAIAVAEREDVGYFILKPLNEITVSYSYDLKNYPKAIAYGLRFLKALKKYDSLGIDNVAFNYTKTVDAHIVILELGRSLIETGHLEVGKMYLDKALAFFDGDYEKSLRIYTHLIDWAIKSRQPNNVVAHYIHEGQRILQLRRGEEKQRLMAVSKELEALKLLKSDFVRKRIENKYLKEQRLTILISFFIFLLFSGFSMFILKGYNKSQKELNEKLANEKILLQSIDRDRNMHLSIIAHELRTPIFTAKGMLDLLKDEKGKLNHDAMEQIANSINYLSNTVNNILAMPVLRNTKVTANELIKTEFMVMGYVRNLIGTYHYLANQKRVAIKLFAQGVSKNTMIVGVKQNLGQVLSNLIHNAIKFSPVDSIITVSIIELKRNSDTIELRFVVKDQGPGIGDELKSEIFEYRKKAITDKEKNTAMTEGLGIGLYIVQKILDTEGSAIHVESGPEGGATFHFDLKFKLAQDLSLEDAKCGPKTQSSCRELNVLVVDDNKLNGLVAKKIVENLGHKAFFCTDEDDFISLIKDKKIDVVITDINMPIKDGYEVSKMIKNAKKIPVIAHTASNDVTLDSPLAKASGLDGVLIKPYTKDDVREKIAAALSRYDSFKAPA